MKLLHSLLLFALPTTIMAQSPVKETLAYSRATKAGIPGNAAASPIPTAFYIYVVVAKGAGITLNGVCVQGTRYAASLRQVETPVTVDRDPAVPTGVRDTLIKRTPLDTYQVLLGDASGPCAGTPGRMAELAQAHEVVVCLMSGTAQWFALADKIRPLAAAAAM